MFWWMPHIMVRVALFFIAGILLGIYVPEILSAEAGMVAAFVLWFLYLIHFFFLKKNKNFQIISGALALSLVSLLGYLILLDNDESRKSSHLLHFKEPIEAYEGIIKNTPEEKEKLWKIELEITRVKAKEWKPITGKILLYISKQSDSLDLCYDDLLLIKGVPPPVQSPGNPHEFDFKRFLSFKKIYHQHFVKSDQVKLLSHTNSKGLFYLASQARKKASAIMKAYLPQKQEQAIALALVLGVNDGLDNDLQKAYSASGAMHVLSVSGLHVSILYAMVLFLLKPLQRYGWSKWFIAISSLMALWLYAFVTGLSPSVLRAVTMFSFVVVAKPFGRGTSIYNTLASSALILLAFNPYLIMSVGFQLSYIAVLGIVYLQPLLYKLWNTQNKILDWIWQITCVSIAAQAMTFALGLLYFHQFPVYFLLANLFVIPGSFAVLILGIVLLMVNWLTPLAAIIGIIFEFSIKILNGSVFLFEDLPFSLINGIYITPFQCWLLVGLVLSFVLLFERKKFAFVWSGLIICIAFAINSWIHFFDDVKAQYIAVYKIPNHSTFELIDTGKSLFFSDSLLMSELIQFHIDPTRLFTGANQIDQKSNQPGGYTFFIWNSKKILWLTDKQFTVPDNLDVDYLIVANNSLLPEKLSQITYQKIILDSSNSKNYIKQVKALLVENTNFHIVSEQGAYIEKIQL